MTSNRTPSADHATAGRSTATSRPWRNVAVWAVTPVVSALLLVGALATPAVASADGCTPIGNYRIKGVSPNIVCIAVKGKGRHVESARVRMDAPAGGVNNVVLRITFFDVNNKQVEQHVSGLRGGNRKFEAYSIVPNKEYPSGRVCGSITENGVERPGACVGIFP